MVDTKEINNLRNVKVTYDPELDKYEEQVPFPKKLALANKQLKNAKFPDELLSKKRISD